MNPTLEKKDYLNIKEWARKQCDKHREDINYCISQGIEKKIAVEMVLKESIIGSGYKAQIRSEYK